jgi:hypothetical protein
MPLTITIEKATNLPLMQDPLASSLQSPFVKVSDTKTALANASCSFTLPDFLGGGSWQSNVIQAQSNPIFNFSITTKMETTLFSMNEIKTMFLEIQVLHHLPLSFTSSNSFVSDLEMEVVGIVRVDLSVLFSLDEVYGWYDIVNGEEGVGQVLLRISPARGLGGLYKELEMKKTVGGGSQGLETMPLENESVVMEEVYEWDGSEWISKMVARPKIKAKNVDLKQKRDLSLENALGSLEELHSSILERFKGLRLGTEAVSNTETIRPEPIADVEINDVGNDNPALESDSLLNSNNEEFISVDEEQNEKTRLIHNSNPFLDFEQLKSISEFMDSVVKTF